MKKLFFLLIAANGAISAIAQPAPSYKYEDSTVSRWAFDVNVLGGLFSQNLTSVNAQANYPNALNYNPGNLKFELGGAAGFDGQVGFFVGKKRHFGLGAGIMYMGNWGTANLNNFHVEYQSTDYQGNTFRQVVTGDQIREDVKIVNYNIPIVLKYKTRFSQKWGFTADAGALVNVMMQNSYTTHASFDYEAIYQYNGEGVPVYDNSPVPANNDWLITKGHYLQNNPSGNVQNYFNTLHNQGYNVGLGVTPHSNTGTVSYTTGSVGFIAQPSLSYYLSDRTTLNFGFYYTYQPFSNTVNSSYRLTNNAGDYSSVLNNVKTAAAQSYGINVGMRFFLAKRHSVLKMAAIEPIAPSQCGMCDGGMVINGLRPGKPITVYYSKDGVPQPAYTGDVAANGTVKISPLCAGSYTAITARVKRRRGAGNPVTIQNPPMTISSENSGNPTAYNTCDGTITINGLYAGQPITVNYMLNGTSQTAYTGTVAAGGSVTLTGLCGGSYTGIVASNNNCTANGTDVTLTAPAPPPPAPAPAPVEETIPVSTPILFNIDKATVHKSSYPVLEEAAKEMKEDKSTTITIDGYADITGPKHLNDVLSKKRANAVKTHLVKMGISPRRLRTRGHGSKSPAATNKTAEGRAQNRRAVMHIHGQ